MGKIEIHKTANSKISSIDFDKLAFGSVFSDHMLVCDYKNNEWQTPKIVPYGPVTLNPAAKIFHYGQSIFEGMKAYKDAEGSIMMFRPKDNWERFNKSAARLQMPEVPESIFMDGLSELLRLDHEWIPTNDGSSLYIRPFMFASGEGFHASPADGYTFVICTAPSGSYFSGEVRVLIEEKYARAANGGVGYAKAGGNYAAQFYPTHLANKKGYQQVIWTDDNTHEYIEEAGAMNIFVRIGDTLLTSPTSDRILDGITRKSIIQIAKDNGFKVEERRVSVKEVIEAAKSGKLKEMFGSGTAAVISPISGFGYKGDDFDLPIIENSFANNLKKLITEIQTNKTSDPYGWRHLVS